MHVFHRNIRIMCRNIEMRIVPKAFNAELDKLRNNTFLSMVMGETPVSDFDKFVEQWKAQGGDEIAKEVNEWYQER